VTAAGALCQWNTARSTPWCRSASSASAAALVTAFVSGWFAVWFLVSYLKTRSLRPFVVYRLLLALVIFLVVLRG